MRLPLMLLFLLHTFHAATQPLEAPNAIPFFFTQTPPHKFATQFNLSAGTGRIAREDKPLLSPSVEVKGMYNLTGAIYLSTGGGITYLHSQERAALGEESLKRDATLLYFPSGIGFTIGDDHACIITGIDILPGFYISPTPDIPDRRVFTYGLGPELGFLFRAGPRYTKGLLVGMVGKLQFMQFPDASDPFFRYTYGGIGLVVRFY